MFYKPLKDIPFYKVYKNADEVVADIPDGAHINAGAFGLCGIQENLIDAMMRKGTKDLTIGVNTPGFEDFGIGKLLANGQVKKIFSSFIAGNKTFSKMYKNGDYALEFTPQGTLGEMMRAAGAGIPAFYTTTGTHTLIENGGWVIKYERGTGKKEIISQPKESRELFDKKKGEMRHYIKIESLQADYAFVKADVCDWMGNCRFRKTAQNFNPDVAKSGKICIVEAEKIVEPGELQGDDIHLPSVYVHRIVQSKDIEKRIEVLSLNRGNIKVKLDPKEKKKLAVRERIAKRACKEFKSGMYINLGIGIPTMIPAFLPKEIKIFLHGENGILGMGPPPKPGQEDPDLINASKETVTTIPGHSFFSTSESFGIIRGGHLAMTCLGAMQVSSDGDIANWYVPSRVTGMGGAMDLVTSGSTVLALMEHTQKGAPKILEKCTVPLTGAKCLSKVITERAVFNYPKNGTITLQEIAKEFSLEDIRNCTAANFAVADTIKQF